MAGLIPFDDDPDFESINLLTEFPPGASPTFKITPASSYSEEIMKNASAVIKNHLLPPNFLLSLSYRPHDNTVLRLLSAKRTSSSRTLRSNLDVEQNIGEDTLKGTNSSSSVHSGSLDGETSGENSSDFASVILGLGMLYLQPSQGRYFSLWSEMYSHTLHDVVFIVSNGTVSSCVDGVFKDSPSVALWDLESEGGDDPVEISFSRHLQSVQQLVSG